MKRILAIILTMALVLSFSAMTLVSCDDKEDTKVNNPVVNDDDVVIEGDIFAERAAVPDGLATKDFGGKTIRFATHTPKEVVPDDEDLNKGNLLIDATSQRNEAVEKRFNVKIEIAYKGGWSDVCDYVSKTILSATDEFDVLQNHVASTGGLVLKDLFLNWYDIPNIDFSKPWWSPCNANELTYDGKCILAVSDLNQNALKGTYCIVFNKNLANAYDMGNLYSVALEGKWTYDYFYNLIKDIYEDTDGSGTRTDGDFYGYAQAQWWECPISAWLWAFDNPTVAKNEDGIPELAVKTDKINDIVTTIYDLCYNTDGCHYKASSDAQPQGTKMFLTKNAIFTQATLSDLLGESFRDFEDDYGVLPHPKWNDQQENYLTMASGEHTVLAIPKTAKDLEFIGTIVEAMSAESWKLITPTFYEVALKTRYLRDNESKEVLDLVIDGRVYEFGYIYDNWKGFGFMLGQMMKAGNKNFESFYATRKVTASAHFKSIIKAFDKL